MKITKISELIKALEYSKECAQTDDLSEILSVYVENQARSDGAYVPDPVIFSENDGDPSLEVKIIATDAFKKLFMEDEPSRMGRSWDE